jgi:hypothetical protein
MTLEQIDAFDKAAAKLKTDLDATTVTQSALDGAAAALETATAAHNAATAVLQADLDAVVAAGAVLGLAINVPQPPAGIAVPPQ